MTDKETRDYVALHAPINYKAILDLYGYKRKIPQRIEERDKFFDTWVRIQYEYADAVLRHRKDEEAPAPQEEENV